VVTVPQVVGLHPRRALDALVAAGLEPMIVELPALRSDGSFGYAVADQHPRAAADVAFGARVELTLREQILFWGGVEQPRLAEPGTPAPHVLGLDLEDAIARVAKAMMIARVLPPERPVSHLSVCVQDPAPGAPIGVAEVVLSLDGEERDPRRWPFATLLDDLLQARFSRDLEVVSRGVSAPTVPKRAAWVHVRRPHGPEAALVVCESGEAALLTDDADSPLEITSVAGLATAIASVEQATEES